MSWEKLALLQAKLMAVDADAYAAEIRAMYDRAELLILEEVRKRAARAQRPAQGDAIPPGWAERKAAEVLELQKWLQAQLKLLDGVSPEMERMILAAWEDGGKEAGRELLAADLTNPAPQAYVRGAGVRALASETVAAVTGTHRGILRSTLDAYRSVIAAGAGDVVTGVATRQDAVQRALNAFADRGITGFTDAAGRKWDLGSYAEMATRTAVIRSSVKGKLDKYEAAGVDLVLVSDHWEECDLCAVWEGKVLSRSGATKGYPTVADAEAEGLLHPNCRHTFSPYVEGLTKIPKPQSPASKAEAKEVYQQRMTQRRLERGVRQWKRRQMAALDPVEEAKAARKVSEWEQGLKGHIEAVNRQRRESGFPEMKRQTGRERVIFAPDAVRTPREAGARRRSIKLQAEAREQAQYVKERTHVLREWMDSSSKPASIVTKTAAAEVFGGHVWNPRRYSVKPVEVAKTRENLKKMHSETQEYLKREGVKSVKLYRGIKTPQDGIGSVEAWSESPDIARRFAGENGIILVDEVPAERLLFGHRVPGWKDSKKFGPQQEWMVLAEAPQ